MNRFAKRRRNGLRSTTQRSFGLEHFSAIVALSLYAQTLSDSRRNVHVAEGFQGADARRDWGFGKRVLVRAYDFCKQ
jgi:hypothetical protein